MAESGFPGAVSVSHLQVYDFPVPDADQVLAGDLGSGPGTGSVLDRDLVGGGTPHLHTVSAEAYVVLAGTGAVQTLDGGGAGQHALAPGEVFWFTPGTVHRLLNTGGLEIVVIMQNRGLPEAGDAVLTFPPEVLEDPDRYQEAVRLPTQDAGPDAVAEAARRRRDRALEGYFALRERVEQHGPEALQPLHQAAAALVKPRLEQWTELWEEGARAQADRTGEQLARLATGDGGYLAAAWHDRAEGHPGPRRAGMCGWLRTFPLGPS